MKLTPEDFSSYFDDIDKSSVLSIEPALSPPYQFVFNFDKGDKWREQFCDAMNYHAEKVAIGFSEWINSEDFIKHGDGYWYYDTPLVDISQKFTTDELYNKYLEELK